jgi:glycosyltransferase involved in cell wall biosynthesis
MTGVKRGPDVLRAFKKLRDQGVDAMLCMVGDGPERDELEELAGELGLMQDCLFTGYQEDVGPFFAAFDAFVLPSANEGTPVTAIESLASGCPDVATRVGGVPDVVEDGVDGILVGVGDLDALAAALARLAADPELRRRMGEAGRTRVLPRYAVERLIADVDVLYRRLLEQKGVAVSAADARTQRTPASASR